MTIPAGVLYLVLIALVAISAVSQEAGALILSTCATFGVLRMVLAGIDPVHGYFYFGADDK